MWYNVALSSPNPGKPKALSDQQVRTFGGGYGEWHRHNQPVPGITVVM
jgi:hypothetical protein